MTTSSGKTVFTSTTTALLAVALFVLSVQPVIAAQQNRFANGATFIPEVQWVPNPVDPSTVSGNSDDNCSAASSQPGGAAIRFTFAAFTIPSGNIIQGIELKLDYETDGVNDVQLYDSSVPGLIGAGGTMPAAPGASTCVGTSWTTAGHPTEMWGTSLDRTDFNAGNIGFQMTQPITTVAGDPGSFPVDIDAAELVVYFGPANSPPTADAGGPYSVTEGGSVPLSGAGSSDPNQSTASLTFEWDLDGDAVFGESGETGISPTFSAAGLDGPTPVTVQLRVTDNGTLTDTDTATVNVTNVAPTVGVVSEIPEPSNEGVAVTASATYTDPGTPDTHTCTVDYGDGTGPLAGTATGGTCTGPPHVYVDDDPTGTPSDSYTVTVAVTDDDGGNDSNTGSHTVNNVAPTVGAVSVSPEPSNEGAAVIASATYTDPGAADTHTCTVDYGDGSGPLAGTAAGGTCTGPSHIYVDDDPTATPSDIYTVIVTVTDDDTGSDSNTGSHTVNNVTPTVGAVSASPEPSDEGAAVIASATYTDPGTPDTHTCTVDYGDGSGPVAGTAAGGTCTGPSHIYVDDDPTATSSDIYTVTVTVTDDDTGSASNTGSHTVNNVAPTIDSISLSSSSIDEGDPTGMTVLGSFSDPALGVATETFTGTAVWSDGPSTPLTVNGDGTFETSRTFPDDHPLTGTASDVFTVDITITDDDTGSDTETSPDLTVNNVDPTITATTNSAAECGDTAEGMPVDVTADFSDPGFGSTEDFAASTIDWGDGFVEPATVAVTPGSFGTPTTGTASGTHVYATGGIFTITVTVIDDDTGSATTAETALVTGAGLTPAGLLGVVGTDYLDVVGIQVKHRTDIVVMAGFLGPGKATFLADDVASIEVQVCDGNDQIHVNDDISKPAVLDGGPGPDHIRAGTGYSIVLGGLGNDTLFAGKSGTWLDGGLGDDDLNGNRGDDMLDGGPGVDDCDPGKGTDVVTNCES